MAKKTVGFVTGSRADYGLLEPLIEACEKRFEVKLFVTGSHLSKQFGYTVSDIEEPIAGQFISLLDSDLPDAVTYSQSIGLSQFATEFKKTDIDLLIVLGDRFEIVPPVLAAYNIGIPVVHIQSDDITLGSLDEGYRGCIRSLATYHFSAKEYGSLGCVFPKDLKDKKDKSKRDYEVIIIYHPCLDWSEQTYKNILEACEDYSCLVISSNADAGGRRINKLIAYLKITRDFDFFDSLSRKDYLEYLAGAKFIIGNSSSGIIEAPTLKVPSIDVGDRQKGRMRSASVIHSSGKLDEIKYKIECVTNVKWNNKYFKNPYYKPDTLQHIVKDIEKILRV